MTRANGHQGQQGRPLFSGLLPALLLGIGCLTVSVGHAQAATAPDPLSDAFADGDSTFKPMNNDEMASARGGFDGVAFGIFVDGVINQPTGNTLPVGVTATVPAPNQIQIIGAIGNLAGASGVFQFVNVVGNSNVINNNVIINVTVLPTAPADSTFLH
jgi:hypothetical protein